MCGRFTLISSAEAISKSFEVSVGSDLIPSYNIAPSQSVYAVVQMPEIVKREIHRIRWGLIPSWAKDPAIGYKLINARSETASEKSSFRYAFKHRRCLIPTNGFYEWQRVEGSKTKKQPYFFGLKDENIFAFAGLWERWESSEGDEIETCTILTTEANETISPIHDRMPVILNTQDYNLWLDPSFTRSDRLNTLLKPYPAEAMTAHPVSTKVNSPKNNSPECKQPIDLKRTT
jgi:putative SOS response-associated peptidase YedK